MAPSTLENKPPVPRHIAIIMDGNGRWAKKRGLPRTAGHVAGAEAFRRIANYCRTLGVEYLTVYAFSTEHANDVDTPLRSRGRNGVWADCQMNVNIGTRFGSLVCSFT